MNSVIQAIADGSLSSTDFPFTRESNSERKSEKTKEKDTSGGSSLRKGQQPRWADKKSKKGKEEKKAPTGPRVIVYFVGGVTYSEMRSAYELSSRLNRQVIIGGDYLITPDSFLESIRSLKQLDAV